MQQMALEKEKLSSLRLGSGGGVEGPGPSFLVCTPKPKPHALGQASLCPYCTHGHQVAQSHWGILLWGGLWVLPGTLRQMTHGLVVGNRREVRASIAALPGDPSGPTNSHTPVTLYPLPPGGAAGALLACSYGFPRSPRVSFLSLKGPLWCLETKECQMARGCRPGTSHTQGELWRLSVSRGHCSEPSEARRSGTAHGRSRDQNPVAVVLGCLSWGEVRALMSASMPPALGKDLHADPQGQVPPSPEEPLLL